MRTLLTLALVGVSALSITKVMAAGLESQMKALENSVQTVEQRQKAALKDLNANVLMAYRDSIKIDQVSTSVAEVFDKTARIEIRVSWHVDQQDTAKLSTTLNKYFMTTLGMDSEAIYSRVDHCNHNEFCAVNRSLSRYMKSSAVGVDVSFLGDWQPGVLMDGWGTFPLRGAMTYSFEVSKLKIKGNPQPEVKTQIYDVIPCTPSSGCTEKSYDRRRS